MNNPDKKTFHTTPNNRAEALVIRLVNGDETVRAAAVHVVAGGTDNAGTNMAYLVLSTRDGRGLCHAMTPEHARNLAHAILRELGAN